MSDLQGDGFFLQRFSERTQRNNLIHQGSGGKRDSRAGLTCKDLMDHFLLYLSDLLRLRAIRR